MNDLSNLQEILDILNAQDEMMGILESQQTEIESLTEQVEELTTLNEQLTTQVVNFKRALKKSNEQNEKLLKQIDELQNSKN